MYKSNNEKPSLATPSAPPQGQYDDEAAHFSQRAPPPSYEESQKMCSAGPQHYPQLQQQQQFLPYAQMQPIVQYQQPMTNAAYGGANAYQWQPPPPMQQYQQYCQPPVTPMVASVMTTQNSKKDAKSSPQVLTLAKGAKIRTTATGAVSIPPPPPGCVATPAQYAAMQGQPVLVKKTKKSFF